MVKTLGGAGGLSTLGLNLPRRPHATLSRDDGYCATVLASFVVMVMLVMTIVALIFMAALIGVVGLSYETDEALNTDQAGDCVADVWGNQPSSYGDLDLPRDFYDIYRSAGQEYSIEWYYLAGIGWEETDHGQWAGDGSHGPTGLERDTTNDWGAAGPMQFGIDPDMPASDAWSTYGVDGNGDGRKDVWDPRDAIPSAANMITKYIDERGSIEAALYRYNQSNSYVQAVMDTAARYESGDFTITAPMGFLDCEVPDPNDSVADGVVDFVEDQVGEPYEADATGPDAFGPAGLVHAAYDDQGVEIPDDFDELHDFPNGARVPIGDIEPSDVLFTASCDTDNDEDSQADHALVYTGGDTLVHASEADDEVVETDMDDIEDCSVVKVLRMSHLGDS
ncbi:lytic murein transglycosylase [Spiractinospora alimapuensis]|uniref:C40 family peptidase n=1 Tax=Spiractinospora alimapuensis TaxID=2820884 RepID=UPI001F2295AD|nr:lytic murein transglycosylase [Spiractinospora alimapuensis]QVQ53449.1 lytic murein transglycosylase [Spiractinospora alimapuensis]